MMNCFQICFKFAFKFNLRRYSVDDSAAPAPAADQGGAVQVGPIKTRVESAYGVSA